MELPDRRLEAFARALARGLSPTKACIEAGYNEHGKKAIARSEKAEVVARKDEIIAQRIGSATRDVGPIIDELVLTALAARKLNSGAALAAARGLLAEAARLKQLLPPTPEESQNARFVPPEPVMDHAAWMARFAPHLVEAP